MSQIEEHIEQQTDLPDENAVVAQSSGKAFRFAAGKIVRGQENPPRSGVYAETLPKIVGRLRRVGIHEGVVKSTGTRYRQIEADIDTKAHGMVHIKASLLGDQGELKPSVAAVGFAWGLLQFKPGDDLMIQTQQGEPIIRPNGQAGGCPTYVNFYRVVGTVAERVFKPRRDKFAPRQSVIEQWNELEPQILAHPAYADRPQRDDEDGGQPATHLAALCAEAAEKGWPTPQQAPAEWLAMLAGYFGHAARASVRDYTEDEWGEVRQALQPVPAASMPGMLLPAKRRIEAASAPAAPAPAPSAFAPAAPAAPKVDASAFGAAVTADYDPFNE